MGPPSAAGEQDHWEDRTGGKVRWAAVLAAGRRDHCIRRACTLLAAAQLAGTLLATVQLCKEAARQRPA